MDLGSWGPIVGVAVGAVLSAGWSWITTRNQRKREDEIWLRQHDRDEEQWRRQQAVDAFNELMGSVANLRSTARIAKTLPGVIDLMKEERDRATDPEKREEHAYIVTRLGDTMKDYDARQKSMQQAATQALSRLVLFASADTHTKASVYLDWVIKDPHNEVVDSLWASMINALRKDLGQAEVNLVFPPEKA